MNASASDWDAALDETDGRHIYYRPGDVIAVGQAASTFVSNLVGSGPATTLGLRSLPGASADLFRGSFDSLDIIRQARSAQMRVQLNHVLLTHTGVDHDPCCPGDSGEPHPLDQNGQLADPVKANPVKANVGTSAEAVPSGATPLLRQDAGGVNEARIWILDTGLADSGTNSPLSASSTTTGDHSDRLDDNNDDLVDVVAGHGTFIAGIIRQLGPKCQINVLDVMDEYGQVLEAVFPGNGNMGLLNVMDNVLTRVDDRTILNLSFGGDLYGPLGSLLEQLVSEAQERGAVVVASAGNDASCRPSYPAAFPGVVSVGAIGNDGLAAKFTNYGSWVRANALGVNITSTFLESAGTEAHPAGESDPKIRDFQSGWAKWSGTSFAAPVVTAAIALGINGDKTAAQARDDLLGQGEGIECLGVTVAPPDVDDLVPA